MEIETLNDSAVVRLTNAELQSLGLVVLEGCYTMSRAEFFIRTGLSQSNMTDVARALLAAPKESAESISIPIEDGVESVENPRRPRPPRKAQEDPGSPQA